MKSTYDQYAKYAFSYDYIANYLATIIDIITHKICKFALVTAWRLCVDPSYL